MTFPTEISVRYDLSNGIFNTIAKRYDRTNTLVSFGFDRLWQRKLIREVQKIPHQRILDLACGTGTLTSKLSELEGALVTGLDPSVNMLAMAKGRTAGRANIVYCEGYAESLPFPDNSFQVVTVSYGVRNFADRDASFVQMLRVLRPGGWIFVLEFSLKTGTSAKFAFQRFYVHDLLPLLGWLSTGEKKAYEYLRDSVESFPSPGEICLQMAGAGYINVEYERLVPGVAVLFTGQKRG
ncbi:MAG: ubiquinone/menaquinone biosynthesis methyltransferase [Bacteroidales bacterium]|jgi:demethylmenaquinone methyltransferase/2-methoxy-6-polyprenyl-1,4-benzoquinol methylase|nr:ubiquinone/menaquinone biosynthesis methyltransferase [Bacteroidales bacterium]MDD2264587.1 ubiquinone/menaquinone biosynthesis methyltransferase [Bacteroidales bacterium]MDD2831970.1 ubiquinone/menaquinone biosynthesis methyltransferase [Bacteroidales bacterium]MDD3208973.1 ubiquinone/menaquinone biosynthesis methyltransferase [Bacteroidales bacterium]MDD3697807.1 ubiquinone/menaquinone biosynthesis methyltransferase [Bacteroidales bacterium]